MSPNVWETAPWSLHFPMKLVLCGDFYQLPPVPDQHDGLNLPILFTFEADSWKRCVPRILTLTRVFRQKDQG